MHDHIEDRALYPGHVVRQMLQTVGGGSPAAVAWLELAEAAAVLQVGPRTLRRRCSRWARMPSPLVRVRKGGPDDNSHWRLAKVDVYKLAGKEAPARQVEGLDPEDPEDPSNVELTREQWDECQRVADRLFAEFYPGGGVDPQDVNGAELTWGEWQEARRDADHMFADHNIRHRS